VPQAPPINGTKMFKKGVPRDQSKTYFWAFDIIAQIPPWDRNLNLLIDSLISNVITKRKLTE
jgi:hypothetical protein